MHALLLMTSLFGVVLVDGSDWKKITCKVSWVIPCSATVQGVNLPLSAEADFWSNSSVAA